MFQGEIASQNTTDTVPDTVTLDTANALREEVEITPGVPLVTKAMSPLLAKLLHAAAVSPDGTARIMIGRPNPLSQCCLAPGWVFFAGILWDDTDGESCASSTA